MTGTWFHAAGQLLFCPDSMDGNERIIARWMKWDASKQFLGFNLNYVEIKLKKTLLYIFLAQQVVGISISGLGNSNCVYLRLSNVLEVCVTGFSVL